MNARMFGAAALALSLSITILAGCATQPTPPVHAGCVPWAQQQVQGSAQALSVSVLSPDLAKVIGVQEVVVSRTGTGLAAVQAAIQNCSDVDVVLSVRTRFGGGRGQSEPPSAWRTVHLAPRAQAVYVESAVSPATQRMSVDVHDANRGQAQFEPGQAYGVPLNSQSR